MAERTSRKAFTLSIKKDMFQYVLIYFLFLEQDSCIYYLYGNVIRMAVLGICIYFILVKKIKPGKRLWTFLSVILIAYLFTFLTSLANYGQTGSYLMMSISEQLLIAYCAYAYSEKKFIYRYVKVVTFFATISLIMYSIGLIMPNLLLSTLPRYDIDWSYDFNGIFFYTARMREMGRNTGIFREPGLYQIVLNSAVFMCLFYKDLAPSKVGIIIVILITSIITTGSATGYIALFAIIVTFLFTRVGNAQKKWKKNMLYAILAACSFLIINYQIAGDNSFLQRYLFEKISTMNDMTTATTGSVRVSTIMLCLSRILQHPFGIGASAAMPYLAKFHIAGGYVVTGARLLITTLGIGVIPIAILLVYLFYQGYCNHKNVLMLILLIFLYFNTALAQSREFYPALVVLFFIDTKSNIKFRQYKTPEKIAHPYMMQC